MQADAMEHKTEPTTLDQIWGDTGLNKYNTFSEEDYKQELLGLAKVDLQNLARNQNLIPIDNAQILRDRLLREFRKHVAMYNKPIKNEKKDNKISKEALTILAEGK